eukprot:11169829-Lingulodinium_polyedra.AAC.1
MAGNARLGHGHPLLQTAPRLTTLAVPGLLASAGPADVLDLALFFENGRVTLHLGRDALAQDRAHDGPAPAPIG